MFVRFMLSFHIISSLTVSERLRDSLASSEFSGRLFSEHATLFSRVGSDTFNSHVAHALPLFI